MKRLEKIKARKVEIRGLLLSGDNINLAELKTELEGLEAEERGIQERLEVAGKLNISEIRGKEIEKPGVEIRSKGQELSQDNILDSVEYRSAYLKTLQGIALDEIEERAMSTASSSVGAVIPTVTLNKVLEKLTQSGILYPMVTSLNIAGNVTIPVENATADASWVAETSASVDSDDKVNEISLSAHKLIKTFEMTAHVQTMSIDAFESFIVDSLVRKMNIAIDKAIMSGSGENQPEGILTAITPTGSAEAGKIEYDDILTLLKGLSSAYAVGAVIILNRKALYGKIANILDLNKKPIFLQNSEGGFEGKLLGYPVKTYDNMPDNKIVFGNMSRYYFNFAKAIEVASDRSAGFRSGSVVYRAMALCDGKPADEDAFVVLEA